MLWLGHTSTSTKEQVTLTIALHALQCPLIAGRGEGPHNNTTPLSKLGTAMPSSSGMALHQPDPLPHPTTVKLPQYNEW